jgi:hypothetical protein
MTRGQKPSVPIKLFFVRNKFLILIGMALAVGLLGQWQMAQKEILWTFLTGTALFGVSIFIFRRALDPIGAPSDPVGELDPSREKLVFFFILGVAFFMRFWGLDDFPPGLFVDQGYQAYNALKILHENYRPFFDHDLLKAPAVFMYELAAWFKLVGDGEYSSKVFFGLVSLAAFPFIYWFFRQLTGPRTALLALFILAVMRWHVNLCRWGNFAIHGYFFMFSCLAFFLYAVRTGKDWAFWMTGLLMGIGMYYYSAYYVFPLLLLVYIGYETTASKHKWALLRPLLSASGIFFIVAFPLLIYSLLGGDWNQRMEEVSIFSNIKKQNSFRPVLDNLIALALMFFRKGDANQRHDFQSSPMLDNMTAVLFFLGLFCACRYWKQRRFFYPLCGLTVLCLPGVLSTDMPHAFRLYGIVPFVALVAAIPLAMVLGLIARLIKRQRVLALLFFIVLPLAVMTRCNFLDYFSLQMRDPSGWYWWDPVPTAIGRRILEKGANTEFRVTNRCKNNYTVRFLAYPYLDKYKSFYLAGIFPPLPENPKIGLEYVLEPQRAGFRAVIKSLFPKCREEYMVDPSGNTACFFYGVPAEEVNRARGLVGTFEPSGRKQPVTYFPLAMPDGPYRAQFEGCVFISESGIYQLDLEGNTETSVRIGGKNIKPGVEFSAPAGYYAIRLLVNAPAGKTSLAVFLKKPDGNKMMLGPANLTTMPLNHGLLALYVIPGQKAPSPSLALWEQIIDFDYRYTLPFLSEGELGITGPQLWTGDLVVKKEGLYYLLPWSTTDSSLTLDGNKFNVPAHGEAIRIFLKAGTHSLIISVPNPANNFLLVWIPPGKKDYETIPLEAFGITRLE